MRTRSAFPNSQALCCKGVTDSSEDNQDDKDRKRLVQPLKSRAGGESATSEDKKQ